MDEVDEFFDAKDREMVAFAKKVKASDQYHVLSEATKKRIELIIKANEGDADAMIALSEDLLI